MSEPLVPRWQLRLMRVRGRLSRDALGTAEAVIDTALHYQALVADLEKERDELVRVFDANVRLAAQKWDAIERAERAEAGLAAAQKALKQIVALEHDESLEFTRPYFGEAADIAADALARGGGQQDTG